MKCLLETITLVEPVDDQQPFHNTITFQVLRYQEVTTFTWCAYGTCLVMAVGRVPYRR
jgi:hypothetical protein